MPIVVPCACGAKLTVRDEAVGKKIKCPKCAAMISVSAPSGLDGFRIIEERSAPAAPSAPRKRCPYCGKPVDAAASFCEACGHRLKAARPGQGKICPCGFNNPADVAACGSCGADISAVPITQRSGLVAAARESEDVQPSYAEDEGMSALDWILCIIFPCIGLIKGIYHLASGSPSRGGRMIGVSVVVMMISAGIQLGLRE